MMIRDQTIYWEAKHNFERGQPRGFGQSVRAQFRPKAGDCLASFHTARTSSLAICTAQPTASAGRFCPCGPLGMREILAKCSKLLRPVEWLTR